MNDFEEAIPILNVKDFVASVDYYVQKLGFQKLWDWGEPPTFGCVRRGKVEIFFCQGCQGQPGMWMSIFMEDVDALYEEYKKSGAIILEEPKNYPWETREMLVEDLDGHRFRMSGKPK
ncbi:MAG TPA: bleomycin resistance family protein [Pyrinomonadaceae bacterium]